MFKTKEELVTAIIQAIPYSDHISDLDFTTETNAVIFTWRKTNKFRVTISGGVDEVGDGVLIGSDMAILVRELIKKQWGLSLLNK